ncbi:MAG TPA: hypothetical protein VE223_03905, partial [Nitrososphaeraceae archaeon]|nr:hypothetical protein [Nitrososphaeraceae archaeon]
LPIDTKERILSKLYYLRKDATQLYYRGKLNKTDYEDFLKKLEEEGKKISTTSTSRSTNNESITSPTKSIQKSRCDHRCNKLLVLTLLSALVY